jgi:hypothetical protein
MLDVDLDDMLVGKVISYQNKKIKELDNEKEYKDL